MGQQIIYCASCGTKILDRDFQSRAAFRLDHRGFCKKCAPAALKALPPDKLSEVLAQISEAESPQRKAPSTRRPSNPAVPTASPVRERPATSSRTALIAGSAGVAVVVVALLVVTFSGSGSPPPPKESTSNVDREAAAARALRAARELRDVAAYERLAAEFKGTRAADDARREADEIRRRAQQAVDSELKILQEQARGSLTTEEFQKTIQALTDARSRHPEPAWTQSVDRMVSEVRAVPEQLYPILKTAAMEARRKGAAAEMTNAKERLAKWGIASYAEDLEAALAALPASGRRPLINGKDLAGWEVTKGRWVAKDGLLELAEGDEKHRANLLWIEQLRDFDVEGPIEAIGRIYVEIYARGVSASFHLSKGWHTFRAVASGADVKFIVDDLPVESSGQPAPRGQFSIFTIGSVRLKDLTIRS